MTGRINCQMAGESPEGGYCHYWDQGRLLCTYDSGEDGEICLYQVDLGITGAQLAAHEAIPVPDEIARKVRLVREGAERIRELWGEAIYQSVLQAMAIVGKYQPGDPNFHVTNLQDFNQISADIVYLTALSTHVAVVLGEADATFKALDAWRSQLHGRKYMAIKESYVSGLRRGKPTDRAIEYDVRCDPEYSEAVMDCLRAEKQAIIMRGFNTMVIELVNALKKRIETRLAEWKYAGRQS